MTTKLSDCGKVRIYEDRLGGNKPKFRNYHFDSELKQMSLQLKSIITPEAEDLFVLKGTDLFRRPLKQIGNSIFNIKTTFVKRGEFNVVPKDLDYTLCKVKDSIGDRINDGSFQDKCFDLFRDDISSDTKASDATIFLYEYLPMALGIKENLQPPDITCDVLIVQPNFPVLLLTVIKDQDLSKVRLYNTRLARSTTSCLSRFIDADFHLVSDVMKQTDLNNAASFTGVIKHLISRATCFVTSNSLFVGMVRYDKIITAVFASICETQSVQLNDDNCKFLHFLTEEQGEILVEKLNSSHVNVVSTPKAGSTTLLLEVVRRLSSMHKTLLICRTREEGERLRLFHPDTVSLADLPLSTLSEYLAQYRHVIDETGTVKSHQVGKLWEFTKEVNPDQGVLIGKSSMQESRDHEAYSCNDDSEKGGPTLPSMTVEGHDVMKETGPILSESDKDVHIAALKSQIQAMRAKLLHQTEEMVKQERNPEWSSTKLLHQTEDKLKQELKPECSPAKHLPQTEEMLTQELKPEWSSVKHLPQMEVMVKHELKSELSSAKYLQQTKEMLKQERKPEWSSVKLLPQTEEKLKQELKPELSSVKHLPQTEEMLKQELKHERSPVKLLPQMEERLKQELKPELSSVKHLPQTEKMLKQELKPEWSLQKVKIKQEPTEIPTDYGSEKIHQQEQVNAPKRRIISDSSDSSDTGGESRDDNYFCPLCSATCTSENDIKQHFLFWHLAAEESALPAHHVSTTTDVAAGGSTRRLDSLLVASSNVAVAGPSHRPDSFPVASSNVAEAGPSHRPDSPRPTGPNGMKRVKVTYLECPHCPKRFKTERGCKRHMKTVHPEPALRLSFDESGDAFYLVGEPDAQCQVSCPSMTLDSDRVNRKLHVSEDGLELVNTKNQGDSGGFSRFWGTCSRLPLPLPPSPSTLTTPRYWETRTRVRVEREELWRTLLEMGVSGEREVDTFWFVSLQPRDSWAVWVGVCDRHKGICTQVWSEGRQVGECRTNTVSNTPGTTQDLNYGVVLDVRRGVVAFLDLDRGIVLSIFNVQFRESLRPMFSVCTYPSYCTVKMRLVSGGEITMTDTKKHLIYQALTTT